MKIRVFDSKLSKVYVIWNNILRFRHVKFTRFFESVGLGEMTSISLLKNYHKLIICTLIISLHMIKPTDCVQILNTYYVHIRLYFSTVLCGHDCIDTQNKKRFEGFSSLSLSIISFTCLCVMCSMSLLLWYTDQKLIWKKVVPFV